MVLIGMLQTAQQSDDGSLSPREIRARQANTAWGRVLRYVGLIVGIYVGWQIGIALSPDDGGRESSGFPIMISASLGALFFLLTPYLTIGAITRLAQFVRRVEASDLIAGALGLLIGGLVSSLLAFPLSMLPSPFGQYLPMIVLLTLCSVAVLSALIKKRDLMDLVGFRRVAGIVADARQETPSPESSSESSASGVTEPETITVAPRALLDTSAIIDGRIHGLASRGFLPFQFVVPNFVLHELQLVADSDDYSRRTRGDRGLRSLEEMRADPEINIQIEQIDADGPDVDSQLVNVAGTLGIPVISGDSNLERVAGLQDVRVLNLHQLAELMRPALAVGDQIRLKLVQKGREYQQGVGFLDDGTMVVVDGGEPHVGVEVTVVITRTLQTSSGRMMFARLRENDGETQDS
jgi:uncharacterized protein YacL